MQDSLGGGEEGKRHKKVKRRKLRGKGKEAGKREKGNVEQERVKGNS
jgi:hypothetical protein